MKKCIPHPKLINLLAMGILLFVFGGIILIKIDAGVAAQLTDNILRPVFGTTIVTFVEKLYFNSADKMQQVMYNPKGNPGIVVFPNTSMGNVVDVADTPFNLTPIPINSAFTPAAGEGVWKTRNLAAFPGEPVMAYTYVRPDPARPYAYVTIVQVDLHMVRMGLVAGTKEPGGPVGKPGLGKVPNDIISSGGLVAAFNGGFQYRDGAYGMIVGGETYLPLQNNLATIVGYTDGTVKLFEYKGQNLGSNVAFVRQNCPMLVQNSQVVVDSPANRKLWGRTTTASIYTWRSGIGLTPSGNLLFAVGNNITSSTLATALHMAGADSAMQLDINPFWVRFNIFDTLGGGQYKTSTLIKDLKDGSREYFHGYSKDFFYLYKKI